MENGFFWSEKRRTISQFTKYLNWNFLLSKVWNSSLAWVKLWQKFEEEATDKKEVEVSLFPCPFVGSDTSLSFDIFFWVVFDFSRDTWRAKTINKSWKSLHLPLQFGICQPTLIYFGKKLTFLRNSDVWKHSWWPARRILPICRKIGP